MAYTLAQFIAQAQSGGGVLVTKVTGDNRKTLLEIGGRSVQLVDNEVTRSISKGVETDVNTPQVSIDLGTIFTAKQVLDSYSLRQAISTGIVLATAGTTALSLEPVSQ